MPGIRHLLLSLALSAAIAAAPLAPALVARVGADFVLRGRMLAVDTTLAGARVRSDAPVDSSHAALIRRAWSRVARWGGAWPAPDVVVLCQRDDGCGGLLAEGVRGTYRYMRGGPRLVLLDLPPEWRTDARVALRVETSLAHELAHAWHERADAAYGARPEWVAEGLAELVSLFPPDSATFARAVPRCGMGESYFLYRTAVALLMERTGEQDPLRVLAAGTEAPATLRDALTGSLADPAQSAQLACTSRRALEALGADTTLPRWIRSSLDSLLRAHPARARVR